MQFRFLIVLGLLAMTLTAMAQGANSYPNPNPVKLTFSSPSVIGGGSVSAKMLFDSAPPFNHFLTMSSSVPSKAKPPSPCYLAAGSKVKIVTVRTETVLTSTLATIGVTSGSISVSNDLAIEPGGLTWLDAPVLIESPPGGILIAQAIDLGTAFLSDTLPVDVDVELKSSDPSVLSVPASVKILAGNRSAIFGISVAAGVPAPTQVTVRARLGNSIRIATILVVPGSIL